MGGNRPILRVPGTLPLLRQLVEFAFRRGDPLIEFAERALALFEHRQCVTVGPVEAAGDPIGCELGATDTRQLAEQPRFFGARRLALFAQAADLFADRIELRLRLPNTAVDVAVDFAARFHVTTPW
ncbi:MAG: hypothetical protein KDC87_08305 [Planctomycetes bacterium]|nr:hypothetical protein [Planctomycetota bacterium]